MYTCPHLPHGGGKCGQVYTFHMEVVIMEVLLLSDIESLEFDFLFISWSCLQFLGSLAGFSAYAFCSCSKNSSFVSTLPMSASSIRLFLLVLHMSLGFKALTKSARSSTQTDVGWMLTVSVPWPIFRVSTLDNGGGKRWSDLIALGLNGARPADLNPDFNWDKVWSYNSTVPWLAERICPSTCSSLWFFSNMSLLAQNP